MGSEGGGEVVELSLIFFSDFGDGDDGGVFLVNKFSEGGFPLDKAVGDIHLFAEGGEPNYKLDGVDVVGDDNDFGFLLFDEFGDVVESELEVVGFGLRYFFLWVK